MPPSPPEYPITHIYAPRFPHEPLEIIGNKPGLERLINVLIEALAQRRAKGVISTSDRLDSEVRAICLQGRRRPEEWRRAGSPLWDVDDPLIARILELTDENERLRRVITVLRYLRKSIPKIDHPGGSDASAGADADADAEVGDPSQS
jgi:hypothetical protein